jgi:hypothetical protein
VDITSGLGSASIAERHIITRSGIELKSLAEPDWGETRCNLSMSWASIADDFLYKLERVGEKKNQVVCRMHKRPSGGGARSHANPTIGYTGCGKRYPM